MPKNSRVISKILSPVVFILLWYAVAHIIKAPLILPYPHSVIIRFFELCKSLMFWQSFLFSFLRVILAFAISFIGGFVLGLLAADFPSFKAFMQFPLSVIRVTPLVAFILIALFWFKSGSVPVFVAVVMTLPVMVSASEKGFEKNSQNQEKLFKAACYGMTGFNAFRYIRLPSAMPSILAASESTFGLCWKVVAAGEVLSVPRFAAGTMMQRAQVHLETADVLAVTCTLILFSSLCQFLMKKSILKISSKKH